MARADHVGWAKARNAPCPRGLMQVIPCPPPLQDGSMIIISERGHGARSRAWTGPANLPGRAPLPTLNFIGPLRWRSELSCAVRSIGSASRLPAVVPAHSASKTRVNALMLGTYIPEAGGFGSPLAGGDRVWAG